MGGLAALAIAGAIAYFVLRQRGKPGPQAAKTDTSLLPRVRLLHACICQQAGLVAAVSHLSVVNNTSRGPGLAAAAALHTCCQSRCMQQLAAETDACCKQKLHLPLHHRPHASQPDTACAGVRALLRPHVSSPHDGRLRICRRHLVRQQVRSHLPACWPDSCSSATAGAPCPPTLGLQLTP